MTENNIPYWMAFAHAKRFTNKRKMDFLIEIVHAKETIGDALKKIKSGDKLGFTFSDIEWDGIQEAIVEIPNYSFLAEKLTDQGIVIVSVMEKYAYPGILKENLKKDAPIVIYTKGNADLLNKKSIAIVGSRNSSKTSLDFTDRIAKKGVRKQSVIISGFAKGADKQALDSALKYHGQSIVVLPQGIDTYKTQTYYPEVIKGDVLVISTYHPKAPWSVGLAMDRNKTIYGLAEELYVAESADKGGTWEGVINGLKRGRKVFVRMALSNEKNANNILINKGATPVDSDGIEIRQEEREKTGASEPLHEYHSASSLSDKEIVEKTIVELKSKHGKGITVNEVIQVLQLDEKTAKKLNRILSTSSKLKKEKKGKYIYFHLSSSTPEQSSMFS